MNSETTVPVHKGSVSGRQSGRRKASMPLAAKVLSSALSVALLIGGTAGVTGAEASNGNGATEAGLQSNKGSSHVKEIQLEYLDRGLVAASTSEGVFLSWRLLGDEATGYSDKGLTGTDFNVYRDGKKIATVTDSTNYVDSAGKSSSRYEVAAVNKKGKESKRSASVKPWANGYVDIPLQKPADGVTPAGEAYTYSANDMSVGDVDGDGQYEFFVKWDPSNAKDVSQKGYTGKTYIDAYTLDGQLLYRIDLGVNIRAGAHYTQMLVYDFDGDGKAEMMFKTAPGTKIIKYNKKGKVTSEKYITLPKQDRKAGYSNEDDYRLSADGYYDYVVDMFRNWHKHDEVVKGNWPATLEEAFGMEKNITTHYLSRMPRAWPTISLMCTQ